ncbi:hypothetical protein OH77DRAFT_1516748 [Trametes cingulata]|nr:hypothetical protein OH77DRAFT_1516748 [Trametes cingulata]
MPLDQPRLARRDADSGGKLSQSTIIIIAVVCGCVVLLVFALFLWRNLARSCRRSRNVPLPPVRDLAHHREQQLAAFADRAASRPATWVDPPMFHPRAYSTHFLSASASNASLIRHSPDFTNTSRSPTREGSWAVEDAPSSESSPYPTPLSTEDLRAPNPSYFAMNPDNSMASVVSDTSDLASSSAFVTSPSELAHSAESSASLVQNAVAPARPRPPRASRSRSRPLSVVSSAGTMHSMHTAQSMNTLRGPAHSIHSNIQIVLPAPLAPELYPAMRPLDDRISVYGGGASRTNSFYGFSGEGDNRRSVADPWLGHSPSPSRVSVRMEREASGGSSSRRSSVGPRPNSASRPRSSLSKMASTSSLHDNSDSASTRARRAQSQPPLPYPPLPSSQPPSRAPSPGPGSGPSRPTSMMSMMPPMSPPPPVPRIPSMYGNPGRPYSVPEEGRFDIDGEMDEEDEERGRPTRKASQSALPAGAAPPEWDPHAQSGVVPPMHESGWGGQVDRPPPPPSPRYEMQEVETPARRQPSKLRKQRSSSRPRRS